MRWSLVIFDCDGVLVDSEVLSARVEAEELTRLGMPMTTEGAMQRYIGLTQSGMEQAIEREFGRKLPADHAQAVAHRLLEVFKEELQPIPGVRELILRLPVPCCVASNSPPAKLGMSLAATNLFELLYPNIFCSKLVARGKPAPDLFLYAAARFGAEPAQTVVIEDSVAGVTAAKAAGMTVVGFVGGLHHRPPGGDALLRAGADTICDTMADVARHLGLDATGIAA